MWFDVESRYEATIIPPASASKRLWFDVESRYEATQLDKVFKQKQLWFDVESRYEATFSLGFNPKIGCGLM